MAACHAGPAAGDAGGGVSHAIGDRLRRAFHQGLKEAGFVEGVNS
jgi:hypothetical protein